MKHLVLIALAAGLPSLVAQPAQTPSPTLVREVEAFAVRPPDEASPFFLQPGRAVSMGGPGAGTARPNDPITDFPRSKGSEESAAAQIRSFFTGMFSSVNLGPIRTAPAASTLSVEPSSFSLEERREINVTYTIRNNSNRIMRLEYPTSQRIDIVTHDSQGAVVDKWSEDRAFQPEEGIVVINPRERIEYQERIPTREMKPGQAYRVDTFTTATSEDNFLNQQTVNPQ